MEIQESKYITTETGLSYKVLQKPTNTNSLIPSLGKRVTVHYIGWIAENNEKGIKFDSSVDRNRPFSFIIGIGQVIQGWEQGLLNMKIGEKRLFIIPPDLGYGNMNVGSIIKAGDTLIFEIKLLDIQ